jgi:hemoglobin
VQTLTAPPSLYDQLGGAASIAAVVDDFYVRVLADDLLASMFASIDLAHLRRHQARFIGYALGGPNQYTGRSMQRAHEGLGITPDQFAAVAGHLSDALVAAGVPGANVAAVVGHVATLREDVVGR